jgi:hypothetical protein
MTKTQSMRKDAPEASEISVEGLIQNKAIAEKLAERDKKIAQTLKKFQKVGHCVSFSREIF